MARCAYEQHTKSDLQLWRLEYNWAIFLQLSRADIMFKARRHESWVNKTEENRAVIRFSSSRATAGHVKEMNWLMILTTARHQVLVAEFQNVYRRVVATLLSPSVRLRFHFWNLLLSLSVTNKLGFYCIEHFTFVVFSVHWIQFFVQNLLPCTRKLFAAVTSTRLIQKQVLT